ncbi:MAG: hypothetical protein ABI444_13665 [Candidatus Kapaibacterium sp.]|jgi:hypothetical protein
MANEKNIFRYRLDFLYQSIAVYAITLVLYLIARGLFISQTFPIVWEDPILYLLSIITLVSVAALLYNIVMRRRIIIEPDSIRFISSARERSIKKEDILWVHFGRERSTRRGLGSRIVRIRLRARKLPLRIHPMKFEHGKKLNEMLRSWAGLLATDRRRLRRRNTNSIS